MGIANHPSRLALKRLTILHKPDIVIISEPWMCFNTFPRRWLSNLNLKLFAMNSRPNLVSNRWCFCKSNLDPMILSSEDQHVTFSLSIESKVVAFSAIYASTNYIKRRQLWSSLNSLQSQHTLPWCFIGDHNVVIGSHEYRGSYTPARLPMEEFLGWLEANSLYHIPTRGSEFTWSNGRRGNRSTEKRLDISICNQQWLDLCFSFSSSTLTKHKSDHYPLLLEFQITSASFASQFKFQQMWALHPDCKDIITSSWNSNIIGSPMYILNTKLKNLKTTLKVFNKEVFGDVHASVKTVEDKLNQIQSDINLHGPNDTRLNEEKIAQTNLELCLKQQESFWKEKANINWHLEGNRDTKYFHKIAKIKSISKLITTLQDGENTITDTQLIANHVLNYYKSLFCTNVVLQDQLLVEEVIPKLITN